MATNWTADDCLYEYAYWAGRCRDIAETAGRDSESYRAALSMSARWLGRFDAMSAVAA